MSDLLGTVATLRLGRRITCTRWGANNVRARCDGLTFTLTRDEFASLVNEWGMDIDTINPAPITVSKALLHDHFDAIKFTAREEEVMEWVRRYGNIHAIKGAERLVRFGVLSKSGSRAYVLSTMGKELAA